jgi:IclR family pca regulon transcriptional regulator
MGKVLLAYLPSDDREARLDRIQLKPHGPNTVTSRARLVAELNEVLVSGFAISNEEIAYGIRAIAAPVHGRSGNVVGAIGFGVHHAWDRTQDLVRELTPVLQATAAEISERVVRP